LFFPFSFSLAAILPRSLLGQKRKEPELNEYSALEHVIENNRRELRAPQCDNPAEQREAP
jgi:hypothetical protein